MKKLFKWLLLLIATLTVGVIVILYNPSLVKGPLERYLSGVAGYPISLEGDLEIDTGRLIQITAKGIRVSGPDWASHPELAGVDHLKLSVHTTSLFKKIIVIESVLAEGLVLNLETNTDGLGNWLTAKTSDTPASQNDEQDTSAAVVFNLVQINNATLRFKNGRKEIEHEFVIASLDHTQQADGMLHTSLLGSFNERPVDYTGVVGPHANLLNGRDISLTVAANLGELVINGSVLIDDLLEPRRPDFNLEMQGPNIDRITEMLGVEDLGSGGFSLRAKGGDINGVYEADINGEIGDISVSASAEASDLSSLHEFDLNLALNGPSLGSFTRSFGIENWPDKPFSLKGDAQRIGGTLNVSGLTLSIGGTQLRLDALLTNFPKFDASRVKLSVAGDDIVQFRDLLGIPGLATGPFELIGKLDVTPDELELLNVELKTTLGQANLSGTLGPAPDYLGTKLHVHMDGNNAHSLMSALNIDALPEQPFNLNTHIELVEDGLLVERGVLVTIDDDRMELGGFVAFKPGGEGTKLEMKLNGQDLAQMLRRLVGAVEIPARPYNLAGHVQIVEDGLELNNVEADFEGIKLGTSGLIRFDEQLLGSGLDFQLSGADLSSLSSFSAIGNTMDIFIPGQPYQAAGRISFKTGGWQLQDVTGRIGETALDFDGLISNQPGLIGSDLRFSAEGPGLHALLAERDDLRLPTEAFELSGQLKLAADMLGITGFNFTTDRSHGKIDLELGWPVSSNSDANFNVDIQGNDIRLLLPRTAVFKPDLAAYKLIAVGHRRGHLISLENFDAVIGNLQLAMQGDVAEESSDDRVDISISATSEDISSLGSFKGERLPAMKLDLKADFNGTASQFVIRNFSGSLGDSRLEGELAVSLDGPKPEIKLTASSNYIDIRPLLDSSETEEEEGEEDVAGTKQERLIPATPLPLEALAAANIDIKLNIAELRHLKDSLRNLVLDVDLQDGNLNIPQLSLNGTRGDSETSLSIYPTGANSADVKIDLSAHELVFNLSGQPEDRLQDVPTINVEFHANAKGGNLQELAGSINGSLYMGSKGGTLEGVNLSILDTFILDEIFSLILPKSKKDDDLDLTCAAMILTMTDGLVKTDPALAFNTGKISVIAKGKVDLKTEKMNINFNATPNNALKISASELINPYILVGGTLGKPEVGLDPGKVLLHGGAAIGTAGISVLAKGLIDRVGTAIPLCEDMQKKGQQQQ